MKSPWKTLLFERRFRPQLVITVLMPFFQQFTGINAVRGHWPRTLRQQLVLQHLLLWSASNKCATLFSQLHLMACMSRLWTA